MALHEAEGMASGEGMGAGWRRIKADLGVLWFRMRLGREARAIDLAAGMHALEQCTSFLFQGRAHTTSFISLISSCNSSRTVSKVEPPAGRAGADMNARKAIRA